MIPKKIHYCWFGRGEKPKLAQKCIASWKKYCPDYEIIEWNEDNFDVNTNGYTRWFYDQKNWAFLSDFVRLYVVNEYGGVYFDTDVEVVQPIDHLMECGAFFGWENASSVNSGQGFGAEKHHPAMISMLGEYEKLTAGEDGEFPVIRCPQLNTQALMPFGLVLDGSLQKLGDIVVLPVDYMNPYDDPTGRMNKTENTVSIHWYAKSWLSKGRILRSKIMKPLHRIFGVDAFEIFRR